MGGIYVDFSVVNQLNSPALNSNTFANRPSAGQAGRLFVSTDTFEIYRDNGTSWDLIGGPGTSTITGTGTANTFAIFTGAQSIGNSSYLTQGTNAINIANADLNLPSNNNIGGINYAIRQAVASTDYWAIYGNTIASDQGELVFEVGDNGLPIPLNGQRFRFAYNNSGGGAGVKDVFFIDYDNSYFNTNLGINVPSPSGLIHADGGANVARMILDADNNVARIFSFRTDNSQRWAFRVDGNETGSNAGANFQLRRYDDTGTFIDASLIVNRATGKKTFNAVENYTSGLAYGNSINYTLNVPAGTTFTSPNSVSPLLASLILNLSGNATIQSGSRSGADFYNVVNFTSAGTLTINQATTIRALSNIKAGWAYTGTAIGTITHNSGINILFPDNSGQPLNITNNYALLINRQDANTGTITYTNRWGIYQEGSADLNYLNGNLLIKSTVDNGNALQVTGQSNFTGNVGIGTASPATRFNVVGGSTTTGIANATTTVTTRIDVANPAISLGIGYVAQDIPMIQSVNNSTNNATNLTINPFGGNVLIGTTTDTGDKLRVNGTLRTDNKIITRYSSADISELKVGNSNAQGEATRSIIVRQYSVVSLGTKLIIPFISQVNLNCTTLCKVYGHSARYNDPAAAGFEITFSVGHLNSLSNLTSWGGGGNYASIAINGMNIEITFTAGYGALTADGIYVTIEYMTNNINASINVANIAMN